MPSSSLDRPIPPVPSSSMSPIGVGVTLATITVMVYEDLSNAIVLDGPISLRSFGVTLKEWALAGLGGIIHYPKSAGIWVWEGQSSFLSSHSPKLGRWRRATTTEAIVLLMNGRSFRE